MIAWYSPRMELPFTRPEFFQVFAEYNRAIWPTQLFAILSGATAFLLLFLHRRWSDRGIAAILAILWSFTGVGYHWLFFAEVNTAAYLFGALFVLAGLVFVWEGLVRDRLHFRMTMRWHAWIAMLLMTYALVAYPLLGLLLTHPYPETPLFGVVPCPTTIFTLGLLMLVQHPRPLVVAGIPLLWAVIGGSAALLLAVPQDWGLLVAGIFWAIRFFPPVRHARA